MCVYMYIYICLQTECVAGSGVSMYVCVYITYGVVSVVHPLFHSVPLYQADVAREADQPYILSYLLVVVVVARTEYIQLIL